MAGFTDTALAQLRQVIHEEVAAQIGPLGNLLSHGMLPTDAAGFPSRVGLDQLDGQLAAVSEALGTLPDLEAQVEVLRAILQGANSAGGKLVLTFVPFAPVAPPLQPAAAGDGPVFNPPDQIPAVLAPGERVIDQQPGAPA